MGLFKDWCVTNIDLRRKVARKISKKNKWRNIKWRLERDRYKVLFFYKIVPVGCWRKDIHGGFTIHTDTLD